MGAALHVSTNTTHIYRRGRYNTGGAVPPKAMYLLFVRLFVSGLRNRREGTDIPREFWRERWRSWRRKEGGEGGWIVSEDTVVQSNPHFPLPACGNAMV